MRVRSFPQMKEDDRQFLAERLQSLAPWLDPHLSFSALRRTAARLRTGAFRVADPRFSPSELADAIEEAVREEQEIRSEAMRIGEESDGAFFWAKQLPAANDPASPLAQAVRNWHRERRKEAGRSRRKRT